MRRRKRKKNEGHIKILQMTDKQSEVSSNKSAIYFKLR